MTRSISKIKGPAGPTMKEMCDRQEEVARARLTIKREKSKAQPAGTAEKSHAQLSATCGQDEDIALATQMSLKRFQKDVETSAGLAQLTRQPRSTQSRTRRPPTARASRTCRPAKRSTCPPSANTWASLFRHSFRSPPHVRFALVGGTSSTNTVTTCTPASNTQAAPRQHQGSSRAHP